MPVHSRAHDYRDVKVFTISLTFVLNWRTGRAKLHISLLTSKLKNVTTGTLLLGSRHVFFLSHNISTSENAHLPTSLLNRFKNKEKAVQKEAATITV